MQRKQVAASEEQDVRLARARALDEGVALWLRGSRFSGLLGFPAATVPSVSSHCVPESGSPRVYSRLPQTEASMFETPGSTLDGAMG